ncbi:MAG TPA: hypothetical protein VK530_15885 [Candidatus Acidoferrum sp.]|nr:hypothetical protein [Candidatus Acidoferrum sp.]
MKKRLCLILFMATAIVLSATGCKTHSGSVEYIPGKGWVPND